MEGRKHLVYAEDILYKLMQYPDNVICKTRIHELISEVVTEAEVPISNLMPFASYGDFDESEIYD
jgi:hypothetical protein